MDIQKVVRESDLGDDRFFQKAEAFRMPGTMVWCNLHQSAVGGNKKPFYAGGHFGYAESIAEAKAMALQWEDGHQVAIESIIAICEEYGYYLPYKKALKLYVEYDGVFNISSVAHAETELLVPLRKILQTRLYRDVWYTHSRTLKFYSRERQEANDQAYYWSGILNRMTMGSALGTFVERLPQLRGYDFSTDNPLMAES